ncbi:DivIVA domain-containing protein [Kocuria sp.]|uniref:DivIVA domain-containing protein n=1 Tax=Kocuria sp. TaxID=1871328 RepID=UPI0026DD14BC|nr:DivIVA domain-containing protein [Kocuria sp.]MDO4919987.1 DivIVA domain-containing protein [Kocuria sp.]
MALTAEDVINKRFQPTKFREGYDQDEVDDFLDEVVVELRRLHQQNESLRKQVESLGGKPEEAPEATTESASTPEVSSETASSEAGSRPVTESTTVAPATTAAQDTETTQAAAAATTSSAAPAATQSSAAHGAGTTAPSGESAQSAAAVLAMAQKLHDDYVSQGQAERERLITEGRTQADHLVAEGRRTREQTLSSLENEKVDLEAAVAQLRGFEADYRGNLKSFINGQLRELDSTGSLAPADGTGKRTGLK